jgi:hypothetical protein
LKKRSIYIFPIVGSLRGSARDEAIPLRLRATIEIIHLEGEMEMKKDT